MHKLFGRNVRRIRNEKGLTQEQPSERAGVSQFYVSLLEPGGRNPTVASLWELSQALGVSHVGLAMPDGE